MNKSQIIIEGNDSIMLQAAYWEMKAYRDLLCYCMGEGMENTEGYKYERGEYFKAFAYYTAVCDKMLLKYLPGIQVQTWELDFTTDEVTYTVMDSNNEEDNNARIC